MSCPWCGSALGSVPKCPRHGSTSSATDAPRNVVNGGYGSGDDASDEALWASEHLCAACVMGALCRFAPEESDMLVCVSRCRAFVPQE